MVPWSGYRWGAGGGVMRKENRKLFIKRARYGDQYPGYHNTPMALWGYKKGCSIATQLAILGCGSSDHVRLFREGKDTVIYSANDSLEYMSIAYYIPGEGVVGEVFLEHDDFLQYEGLQPINRAKSMLQYLP